MPPPILTEPQRELWQRVREHILAHPTSFDMYSIIEGDDGTDGAIDTPEECGTVACIAGWAYLLAGRPPFPCDVGMLGAAIDELDLAGELLGIPQELQPNVFYSAEWPEPFRTEFNKTRQGFSIPHRYSKRAEIAVRRIDHYLETGE